MGLKEPLIEEGFKIGLQIGTVLTPAETYRALFQDGVYDSAGIARVMHATEAEVMRINGFLNYQLN